MNDHEVERIAAAMNMLRPDWPTKQLKTLLKDERITDRPRRDVCVALSWVACEPASHNPYRVLESGPWWRAAGVEGTTSKREQVDPSHRCTVCSQRPDSWQHPDDHDYSAPHEKASAEEVAERIATLKAELAPTSGPTERRTLEDLAAANPELHARVEAVRAANPGLTAPPLQEPMDEAASVAEQEMAE